MLPNIFTNNKRKRLKRTTDHGPMRYYASARQSVEKPGYASNISRVFGVYGAKQEQ